ncbi:MAG TPA: DUF4468 domain-containing protein [Anaerovoracaceae bacterium]|nr:DUF4468 domain-containing protein [Anaerovoracaceae bacterium]
MKDGSVYYERVIDIDSGSKDELYAKVKTWALDNFRSQKDALQSDDRELGLLAYRSFFINSFEWPIILGRRIVGDWQYWSTMKIYLKDNKAKIVIDNVKVNGDNYLPNTSIENYLSASEEELRRNMSGKGYRQKFREKAIENFRIANQKFAATIASLTEALKSKSKSEFDF